jgi:acyl-CoA hydrolase
MTFLMTPDMANFSGHVHGGAILKLLDQVAYACAARYCKNYVVTASLDQVIFKEPIKVGELVTFRANVNYVGRTSMEIGIKVIAENLTTQEVRHTNSCYFTMVAKKEMALFASSPRLRSRQKSNGDYSKQARCARRCATRSWKRIRRCTSEYRSKSHRGR